MKRETRRLCALLDSPRGDVRCAAALVLGELGDDSPAVVEALAATLDDGQAAALQDYVLEALEKLRSPHALPRLLPLLRREDVQSERLVRCLAALGDGAVAVLLERLDEAGLSERRTIVRTFTRIASARAVRALFDTLSRETPEGFEELLLAVRHEARSAPDATRKTLFAQVAKQLSSPEVRKSKERRAVGVRLLGMLDDPEAFSVVLRHARATAPSKVRAAALLALRSIPRPTRNAAQIVRTLLGFLDDSDYEGVVRPALEALEPFDLPEAAIPELTELVRSRRPELRRFALEKLGAFDRRESAEALLQFLGDDDPRVREPAARALARMASARTLVMQRLLAESRLERAWLLARILQPCGPDLGEEPVRKLGDRVVRHLDHDSRLYEPLLFLLRHASPETLREVLFRRAMRKKRSRRFEETARSLRLLVRHGVEDEEVRFELAVALLKLSKRSADRIERSEDPALERLTELVSEEFPVYERLRKETVLTAEELLWLGKHFVERESLERELGVELLQLVCRKAPRSNLARDARDHLERFGAG